MAYDRNRDVIVLFGGRKAGVELDDTWEWDGSTWTQRFPMDSPSPRFAHRMEFDPKGGGVLLFGGLKEVPDLDFKSDTWRWDGVNWTQLTPAHTPSERRNHGMAIDATGQILLFGGSAVGTLGETWRWDGEDWIELSPAASPGPRNNFGMAYDSVRKRVVVHGGWGFSPGVHYADLWEWDGTDWRLVTPTGTVPTRRASHRLAFHPCLQRIVLYAGWAKPESLTEFRDDTWEWDGVRWTRNTSVAMRPGPLSDHSMVFDRARGRMLLFGGDEELVGPFQSDETWLLGH